MKTAILITEGIKQIMLTPENDAEREALKYIDAADDLDIVIKTGSFSNVHGVFGADVYECQGGYYRAEQKEDSVMIVLRPKKKNK